MKNAPLHLGPGIVLDIQALIDDRLLLNANSGGGKSYALRKICELVVGHAQVIVFDVEGEFHTLRQRFDFSLAGPGGEAPATVASAAKLAERLLELGQSCIIDISDLRDQEQFIANFLNRWMEATREQWHDTVIVLDEASKFCPEGKTSGPMSECQMAILDVAKRGRKRGFALVLATQRISDLNKSAAAECNNVLLGRCSLDVDIDRSAKALGMPRKQAAEVLPALRRGEFFAYGRAILLDGGSPDNQRVIKIQIGEVVTTHPKRGQRIPVTPPPATIKKSLAELAHIADEAQAEETAKKSEVERLRERVAQLERDAIKGIMSQHTPDARREQALESAANHYQEAYEQQRNETERMRLIAVAWRTASVACAERIKIFAGQFQEDLNVVLDEVKGPPIPERDYYFHDHKPPTIDAKPAPTSKANSHAKHPAPTPTPTPTPSAKTPDGLAPAQTRILTVLAQRGPTTKRKILIYARNKRSGATDKAFAEIVANGWASGDPMAITQAGTDILGDVPPLVREVPMGEKHRAFLSVLNYFGPLTKRNVLLLAGYVRSGATDKVFAELVADEWIVGDKGTVRVTADGVEALGSQYVQPPSGRALLDRIEQDLGEPAKKFFQTMRLKPEHVYSKGNILTALGRARSGATDEGFAELVRREYAIKIGSGELQINPDLFKSGIAS